MSGKCWEHGGENGCRGSGDTVIWKESSETSWSDRYLDEGKALEGKEESRKESKKGVERTRKEMGKQLGGRNQV